MLECVGKRNSFDVASVKLTLDVLAHVVGVLLKLLPENLCKKHASHIKTFLAIVVAVIFSRSTKSTCKHSVGHIANEVSLLKHAVGLGGHVRQEVTF